MGGKKKRKEMQMISPAVELEGAKNKQHRHTKRNQTSHINKIH